MVDTKRSGTLPDDNVEIEVPRKGETLMLPGISEIYLTKPCEDVVESVRAEVDRKQPELLGSVMRRLPLMLRIQSQDVPLWWKAQLDKLEGILAQLDPQALQGSIWNGLRKTEKNKLVLFLQGDYEFDGSDRDFAVEDFEEWPEGIVVMGNLTFCNCFGLKTLPGGMMVDGDFHLDGSPGVKVPPKMKVNGNVSVAVENLPKSEVLWRMNLDVERFLKEEMQWKIKGEVKVLGLEEFTEIEDYIWTQDDIAKEGVLEQMALIDWRLTESKLTQQGVQESKLSQQSEKRIFFERLRLVVDKVKYHLIEDERIAGARSGVSKKTRLMDMLRPLLAMMPEDLKLDFKNWYTAGGNNISIFDSSRKN